MQREYQSIDKTDWPDGPWMQEPDKVQWVDVATSLDCLVVRNRMGALCGYVGVPEGHPWFGIGYSSCIINCGEDWCYRHSPEGQVEVHGGITYSDFCQEGAEEDGICHVPFAGRPERVWWFGFDCAHAGDFTPKMHLFWQGHRAGLGMLRGDVYRDLGYVQAECAHLAAQLAAIE